MVLINYLKNIKLQYYLIFLLAVVNLLVAYFFLGLPSPSDDTISYISAMKFLQGVNIEASAPLNRLLTTPLMLYFSIFFSYIAGDLYRGMLIVNIIFYFLIIYFFYKLANEIYKENKIGFLSTIFFLSNYCMYNFGVAYLADMGGWFFFILATYFAVKYYNNKLNKKYFYFAVLSSAVGFLFKEYGALGLISLLLLVLISDFSLIIKIKKIFTACFLFLSIPLIYYLFFYFVYKYSYLDWYMNVLHAHNNYNFISLIKVLGWLYLVGWPVFLYGLWQEKKHFCKERFNIIIALLPASLIFLAWPCLTQRIAFILVPWLALISGFGLSKVKNIFLVLVILFVYIFVNYNINILMKIINLPF